MISRTAQLGLGLAALTVALDRVTKVWALDALFDPPARITVLEVLNLVPVWNRGVSFGLLSSDSPWGPWLLGGFALAVAGALVIWLLRADNRILGSGLGLVIGGAVGNAIDRALYGAVVDFVDAHWGDLHWPAFNIADAAITLGVGFLLLDALGIGTGARASEGGRTSDG
ncbi:MAG: signal peptidase II [Thalassobaculum sp.]|uniref:signal peptidase II n=1 Tax=Thalassobaculum sp. TaxID=2022740 RepID=UPI0032EF1BBB